MAQNDWLILAATPGLHGHKLDALLAGLGSVEAIVAAAEHTAIAQVLTPQSAQRLKSPDKKRLIKAQQWLTQSQHGLVTWSDEDYPGLLREIADPPVALFVRGDAKHLNLPQIAVVGSRQATPGGVEIAGRLSEQLTRAGFCITSGLARGIDAAAHRGALAAGGVTLAVCATGPDRVYPAVHRKLAGDIAKRGVVVTEYLPGTRPQAYRFPRRNRIISGLATGTLVVEAGLRSGALITARLAAEQGREVFAVPGSIHNPVARGCHQLIRNGAKLVETTQDLVEELGGLLGNLAASIEQNPATNTRRKTPDDPQYAQLLSCMGWDPVSADQLVTRSGLTAAEVSSMLLILELEGHIVPLPGGRYQQREEGHR